MQVQFQEKYFAVKKRERSAVAEGERNECQRYLRILNCNKAPVAGYWDA
jgi:hypothetical protein